ncbi:MAG: FKBP-type peptidyl-prolyl cis-trans isomerase [Cyclobacteriaceae bacterium]|nr:FKBP-type peptidyl-prolyl cis-trans isomerase [Cyclobacteriaceae bacterium]
MRIIVVCLFVLTSLAVVGQSKKELAAEVTKLKSELAELNKPKVANLNDETKRASYGLGVLIASNLKNQGGDSVDLESLYFGIQDIYNKKDLIIKEQECSMIVQTYMMQAMEKKTEALKEEGVAFLAANKSKPGVVVTDSGLQYQVITSGKGNKPTSAEDNVTVHYTGKLIDGTVFDSSVERGEPATFRLNEVVPAWTEGLQLMHEGDKWILYVPYEIGFGERGSGKIPPYAALIFEVELIKVN